MSLAIAETVPLETADAGGPVQYAERLASYIADPSRIRSLTLMEYGRAPSLGRCREMRERHLESRSRVKELAEGPTKGFNPDNDNGEHFRVRGMECTRERYPSSGKLVKPPVKVELSPIPLPVEIPMPLGAKIVALVAAQFNLSPADIRSTARFKQIVAARHVTVRVLRDQMRGCEHRFSLMQIARLVGKKDHSTIHHALLCFDAKARLYPAMQEARERVGAMLDG